MNPTQEQEAARDRFATGKPLVIEAGAGTGKTSTLELLARSAGRRRGQYMAFNTALVKEARRRMPQGCNVSTVHSLAFRAVGYRYKKRLDAPRMKSRDIARELSILPLYLGRKVVQPSILAGAALRGLRAFCNSDDHAPGPQHVEYLHGLDEPDIAGRRTHANNDAAKGAIVDAMRIAWRDMHDPEGKLPFTHDCYLKMWQLAGPRIACDYLLFDEGQDASGVMLAIAMAQQHAQLVVVGDSQQAIYEWRGAVNALELAHIPDRTWLTRSFRFGPAIAATANTILSAIGAPLRLTGSPGIPSRLDGLERPDAVLTRTNAAAVRELLAAQSAGGRPHMVGGGGEVLAFMRAAAQLKQGGWTPHPDLACFDSWQEVLDYVEQDPQGVEIKLLVDLVEQFGLDAVLPALEGMPDERNATVTISTAHKAKGREWPTVRLAPDFAGRDDDDEGPSIPELRLLYVACTRARNVLDTQDVDVAGRVGAAL